MNRNSPVIVAAAVVLAMCCAILYTLWRNNEVGRNRNRVAGDFREIGVALRWSAMYEQRIPSTTNEFIQWCQENIGQSYHDPFHRMAEPGAGYAYGAQGCYWALISRGPNREFDIDVWQLVSLIRDACGEMSALPTDIRSRLYDASNGLDSGGDIVLTGG